MKGLDFAVACVGLGAMLSGPVTAGAQEADNAVFHYSMLDVDAARSDAVTVGRWDAAGWVGTDFDRLWWRTEGEGLDREVADAEALLLYGRYVRRFWDFVVGYRQDFEPATQGYVTVGLMGLAPYWFEVGLFGFVSHHGDPSVRFEAETDLFVTQRLILTVGGEGDVLLSDDDARGLLAGLGPVEFGLRTRYEIRRKFAPYLDLTWAHEPDARTPIPGTIEAGRFRLGAGLRLIY